MTAGSAEVEAPAASVSEAGSQTASVPEWENDELAKIAARVAGTAAECRWMISVK